MGILSFAKKVVGDKAPAKSIKSKSKAKTKSVAKTKAADKQAPVVLTDIILAPSLTEKAVSLQMKNNIYTFKVAPQTTKSEIATAVATKYGIKPKAVRTIHRLAKVRRRGKSVGATKAWKRAYVTLPAGKTIDFSV